MKTYEAIPGYSMPTVRVSEDGRVLRTLSFTERGFPYNRPDASHEQEQIDAWAAWKAQTRNPGD